MTEIERLEIAARELADIQENVPDDGTRDVIGWAVHYFCDAIDELKSLRAAVSSPSNPGEK